MRFITHYLGFIDEAIINNSKPNKSAAGGSKEDTNDNVSSRIEITTPTIRKRIEMQDLMQWKHLDPSNNWGRNGSLLEDPILKGALTYLSYVFKNDVYASASS